MLLSDGAVIPLHFRVFSCRPPSSSARAATAGVHAVFKKRCQHLTFLTFICMRGCGCAAQRDLNNANRSSAATEVAEYEVSNGGEAGGIRCPIMDAGYTVRAPG